MKRSGLLFLILIIGLFLRLYNIGKIPPSLNWDEVSIGYNAYSILKTGFDEWGEYLPLHFKSYGEYKLPVQIYASIPAIYFFGLTPFAVRLTPVLYGSLTVLFMYFLAFELFKKRSTALWSAFLVSVSPWHIQLTRASFESSFALMWVVLGMWLLIKGFKKGNYWLYSVIPFVLAMYTYNSARAFIPLFLAVMFLLYLKKVIANKSIFLKACVVFFVLTIPIMAFVLKGEGSARYKLVSVTDEAGLIPRIDEQRNLSTLPKVITNLIHNRYTYVAARVSQNFIAHYTPSFLFVNGAGHRQHHVQGIGELYSIQAPFLVLGLYLLFKKKHKYLPLFVAWNLTAHIPVAFTLDSIPHALRTLNAMPTYQLVTAYGLVASFSWLKAKSNSLKYLVFVVIIMAFAMQFKGYVNNLFTIYPTTYSRDWQYGNKEVVEYIANVYDQYDLIVYSRHYGEPHMFTLFYLQYEPDRFIFDPNLVRYETHDWVRVLNFDKFYFPDLGDEGTGFNDIVAANSTSKILFVGKEGDFEGLQNMDTISFLDGTTAFEIVSYEPNDN